MKNKEYWQKWSKATIIRTVKTMAETAIALIGTNAIGITEVNWGSIASAAALAGIVTILTCIKGLPEVDQEEDRKV